jgi:hypothetical protein
MRRLTTSVRRRLPARMNAEPITVTVSGNQIPASGGVAVTRKNINVLTNSCMFTGSQLGVLAGVEGIMTTDASGNRSFTRPTPGDVVACPSGSVFTCDLGLVLRPQTSWLWPGRNGAQSGYTVEGDIAAMVSYLGS